MDFNRSDTEINRMSDYVIIDTRVDGSGHYFELSKYVCCALLEEGINFFYLSPYAKRLFRSLRIRQDTNENQFNQVDLSSMLKTVLKIDSLSSKKNLKILLLSDKSDSINLISEIIKLDLNHEVKFGIIASLGILLRGWPSHAFEVDRKRIESISNLEQCKVLFSVDPLAIISNNSKIFYLPDFQDSGGVSFKKTYDKSNCLSIGFYGSLQFNRGLKLFLMAALKNLSVTFTIYGYGKRFPRVDNQDRGNNKISLVIKSFISGLKLRFLILLPNVKFQNVYFDSQSKLAESMAGNSAIFYATHLSPYSSGIVNLALAIGIPVIWTPGNSAANDTLEKFFPLGKVELCKLRMKNGLKVKLTELKSISVDECIEWTDFKFYFSRFYSDPL
jgi:hypothetical protein